MAKSKKIKFGIIAHSSPEFLGGVSLFFNNFIGYLKKKKINCEITWIYFGDKERIYSKEGVKYMEYKKSGFGVLSGFLEKLRFGKILEGKDYDVVVTGAGIWAKFYKKPKRQKLVHTFHGTVFYYYKNQLSRYGLFGKIFLYPLLIMPYFGEYITNKADKIICVSNKVKRDVEKLYGKQRNLEVIRTGVDLDKFKKRNRNSSRRKLGLDNKLTYGLYVARGGYWTKGLDRVVSVSKEIYKRDKNYRLLVIGPDGKDAKRLLDEEFIIYPGSVPREDVSYYYASAEVFFCLSRSDGGAPTLVVSEAMSSGCFIVCSKSSEQEIIKSNENGLVIDEFGEKDTAKILKILKDKKEYGRITKNSGEYIKRLSIDLWGEKYLKALTD